MIDLPNYDTLPLETDHQSSEWAQRFMLIMVGETSVPNFDLDLVERMVQAIRNEAAREVLHQLNLDLLDQMFSRWR